MYSLMLLVGTSFVYSLLLTPFVRDLFRQFGMVDHPDELRKQHTAAVPRVGGIALLLAFVFSFITLLLTPLKGGLLVLEGLPLTLRLAPAVFLIFFVGLLDDLFHLRPVQKLLGQVLAAGVAYWAGVRIEHIYGHDIWWSAPATIFWLIACTNAFNLIDGVDGLAAGIGLFATVTTLAGGLLNNNSALAFATAPLVGCLLGFLRYNFNPASVFLGDCGSLVLGFLLGCYGVLWSQKSTTLLGLTAPLMALAVPLLDTSLAVLRRFIRHQPIFGADRGHIHHRLLDAGFSPRRVVLLLYGVASVGAVFSLLQSVHYESYGPLIIVLFCVVMWIGVHYLGYVEFNVAGRLVMSGEFRRVLHQHVLLQHFEQDLRCARTPEECWAVVQRGFRAFGFSKVELQLGDHIFAEGRRDGEFTQSWTMCIPLSEADYLLLERDFDCPVQPTAVAPFVDAVRRALPPSLPRTAGISPRTNAAAAP